MKDKPEMNLLTAIALALFLVLATISAYGFAETNQGNRDAERALLQRMYELRMRFERERAQRENEARANVRLQSQAQGYRVDSPTVSALRADTDTQLARFETQFRCLDVEVENGGGNTVVICGDNSGEISGSNVSAERDIVTIQGDRP